MDLAELVDRPVKDGESQSLLPTKKIATSFHDRDNFPLLGSSSQNGIFNFKRRYCTGSAWYKGSLIPMAVVSSFHSLPRNSNLMSLQQHPPSPTPTPTSLTPLTLLHAIADVEYRLIEGYYPLTLLSPLKHPYYHLCG